MKRKATDLNSRLPTHLTNLPQSGVSLNSSWRSYADGSAPKEPQREVPYVQPSLKAILEDAVQWSSFREFLVLGLPGGFMMQLEGNSYDITTVLAGILGRSLAYYAV